MGQFAGDASGFEASVRAADGATFRIVGRPLRGVATQVQLQGGGASVLNRLLGVINRGLSHVSTGATLDEGAWVSVIDTRHEDDEGGSVHFEKCQDLDHARVRAEELAAVIEGGEF